MLLLLARLAIASMTGSDNDIVLLVITAKLTLTLSGRYY